MIHGRLTCERCAAGTRARIGWQLGLLVAFALFGSGMILFKEGLQWTALIPPLSAGAMTVAAAALMKLQNRRAQRELALGTYPAQLPPLDPRMLDEARTP